MNRWIALVAASALALSGASALAADPPKDAAPAKKADVALKKPDGVTAEAWAKMTDAEKAKAVETAKMAGKAPAKKEKKGGC
jgi:hypothetical protein